MEWRGWAAVALVVPLLPGCLDAGPGSVDDGPSSDQGPSWRPDCHAATSTDIEDGICVRFLSRGGSGMDFEPHLAAHPEDPRTVLVAAMHMGERDGVWAALTRDGGATWSHEDLSADGALPDGIPESGSYGFDPVTAFGPDGEAYVLFLGQNEHVGPFDTVTRISLAKTATDGGSWTVHTVDERPGPLDYHDYVDLAVAPDTGDLYVAGDVHLVYTRQPVKPILFWRSTDEGVTWAEPVELALADPTVRGHYARVAAGAGGLVVVTAITEAYSATEDRYACIGQVAWISRDGGTTFAAPTALPGLGGVCLQGMQPVVWDGGQAGSRIAVAFEVDRRIGVLRSEDAGHTWTAPLTLQEASPGTRAQVFEATAARDGTLLVLERSGTFEADTPRFVAALLALPPEDTQAERILLVDSAEGGAFRGGGHYGGLAEAADGAVWAAWGDPRGAAEDRIAVVHLERVPVKADVRPRG